MSYVYGYDLKENDDIIEAPVQLSQVIGRFFYPEAALVNFLPSLRHIPSWVPWFSYAPLARLGKELGQRTMNEPIDFVKKAMSDGTAVSSLAREQLLAMESLNGPQRQRQEDVVKRVLYVKRRAQAQIDSVVSRDRLPTFEDKSRLPYIEAICKELLRCTPCVDRGWCLPRALHPKRFISSYQHMKDPRAILHNPDLFPDQETFKPGRFLNEDGIFRDDPTISFAFGAGKRICPGRHLAEATLFIVTASVFSVFNVTKAKDENGHETPVTPAMQNDAVASHPVKFECAINPRDKVAEDLIKVLTPEPPVSAGGATYEQEVIWFNMTPVKTPLIGFWNLIFVWLEEADDWTWEEVVEDNFMTACLAIITGIYPPSRGFPWHAGGRQPKTSKAVGRQSSGWID
ncbi:cytochrome P450 [Lactarius psammicola]|nr:cytochrome P450 [Lactarius psammicola]